MFICKIHNNSLGSTISVESCDEGVEKLLKWIESDGHELTDDQIEILNNDLELIIDDDPENIFTYSIGILGE